MSKAPWFPFYVGDFLASTDVQLMEAHEVGAYCLLLAHSWQSDTPGYLPNDEGRLRRLARLSAEAWKESRELLLSKWPVAIDATQRHNPRLVKEAERGEELREKKAEAGRKSAERRARLATEGQHTGNTNPTPVEMPATGVGEKPNQSQLQSQSQSQEDKSSAKEAADAASAEPEKKTGPDQSSESPTIAPHTEGGAADVGTRKRRGKKPKAPPGSSRAGDYQLPEWATILFVEEFSEWLETRQDRTDCRPLTAAAVQARLNELATYDEPFCLGLFRQAKQNPHWQGLTFDNTPHKFTQHCLDLQKLQANATRLNQPERGAKPTEAASYGARAVSAQLRAIRQERAAQNGSHVHLGAAAGTHAGLGSPVPAGVGAPKAG